MLNAPMHRYFADSLMILAGITPCCWCSNFIHEEYEKLFICSGLGVMFAAAGCTMYVMTTKEWKKNIILTQGKPLVDKGEIIGVNQEN